MPEMNHREQSLSTSRLDEVIWHHLVGCGRRPTMAEIAQSVDVSAAQLRRRLKHAGSITFRTTLTEACRTYAGLLIHNGTKIEAAMRLAGFHNKTNFNRQFTKHFGALPKAFQDRCLWPSFADSVSSIETIGASGSCQEARVLALINRTSFVTQRTS